MAYRNRKPWILEVDKPKHENCNGYQITLYAYDYPTRHILLDELDCTWFISLFLSLNIE